VAVSPNIKVIGPFPPQDFSNTTTLSSAMTTAAASLTGSTVVAVDPVLILGNLYLVCSSV